MIPGSDCPISKILSILSSATYNFLHKPHMYPEIAYSKIIQLKMWGYNPTLGVIPQKLPIIGEVLGTQT